VSTLFGANGGHGSARAACWRTPPATRAWMTSGRARASTRWRYGVNGDHGCDTRKRCQYLFGTPMRCQNLIIQRASSLLARLLGGNAARPKLNHVRTTERSRRLGRGSFEGASYLISLRTRMSCPVTRISCKGGILSKGALGASLSNRTYNQFYAKSSPFAFFLRPGGLRGTAENGCALREHGRETLGEFFKTLMFAP
jgi:hypothetical protein